MNCCSNTQSPTCLIDENSPYYCYLQQIGFLNDISVHDVINPNRLNKAITIIIFIDTICSTAYKTNLCPITGCPDYTFILTSNKSKIVVSKFLQNSDIPCTNILNNMVGLEFLIIVNYENTKFCFGYSKQDSISCGGKTCLNTNPKLVLDIGSKLNSAIFLQNLVQSLIDETPNIITVLINQLLKDLISPRTGFCIQKLIKALQCFKSYPIIENLLKNVLNYYVNQPIYFGLFNNVKEKIVINVERFPGTLIIENNKIQNNNSNCITGYNIFEIINNRYYITTNQSVNFLEAYYAKLYPNESGIQSFVRSLKNFLVIFDTILYSSKNKSKDISIIVNISCTGIYVLSPKNLYNILLRIVNFVLKRFIENGGDLDSIFSNLSKENTIFLAFLVTLVYTNEAREFISLFILTISSFIEFLKNPSVSNLVNFIDNLDDFVTLYKSILDSNGNLFDNLPATVNCLEEYVVALQNYFKSQNLTSIQKVISAIYYYYQCFGTSKPQTCNKIYTITSNSLIVLDTLLNISGVYNNLFTNGVGIASGIISFVEYIFVAVASGALIYQYKASDLSLVKTIDFSSSTNTNTIISITFNTNYNTIYAIVTNNLGENYLYSQELLISILSSPSSQLISDALSSSYVPSPKYMCSFEEYLIITGTSVLNKNNLYLYNPCQNTALPFISLKSTPGQINFYIDNIYIPYPSLNEIALYNSKLENSVNYITNSPISVASDLNNLFYVGGNSSSTIYSIDSETQVVNNTVDIGNTIISMTYGSIL